MSLQETEKECSAVAVAPRVRLQDIENAIDAQYAFTADRAVEALNCPVDPALRLLSICILVMRNGFTVIGKSAPASPANFNAELGAKLAYEDAIRQLWPLMGFSLRQQIYEDA